MTPIHVKAAPGRRVRDPNTGQPLPEAGAKVTPSPFWDRRIADEDVVVVPSPTTRKTKGAEA